eukprot:scaffold184186_cov45-Prasinocladus_malaysianus.AAC.2
MTAIDGADTPNKHNCGNSDFTTDFYHLSFGMCCGPVPCCAANLLFHWCDASDLLNQDNCHACLYLARSYYYCLQCCVSDRPSLLEMFLHALKCAEDQNGVRS